MKDINDIDALELLKKEELIDMIVDMEKTLTKYEDKEKHNVKQQALDKLGL
jgi:hypothetical protein